MEEELVINISEDFSRTLGARYKYEGKFSGEEFLEKLLYPNFLKARELKKEVQIYLDGVFGYPSSFVSGSFGKLSLEVGAKTLLEHINLITSNPIRKEKIELEIKNPKRK